MRRNPADPLYSPAKMQSPNSTLNPRPKRLRFSFDPFAQKISRVATCLRRLGSLGRNGQWVLHNEDIYCHSMDTRPHSRDPSKDIQIRDLTHDGRPIPSYIDLIWGGSGPAPDLTSPVFWEGKLKELQLKLQQAEDGLIHHGFTASEMQALEQMESQKDHYFCNAVEERARYIQFDKEGVLVCLFSLAKMGRSGQWILHNEEFYHPSIDTRPQTRQPGSGVVISGLGPYDPHIHEIIWDGDGPQPDFTNHIFWRRQWRHFCDLNTKVEQGLVQPHFTRDELRVLEALEKQEGHFFAEYARHPTRILSPSARAAARELESARRDVITLMQSLWDLGLPGQWVLHLEDIFWPELDTRRRRCRDTENDDDDDGEDIYAVTTIPGLSHPGNFGLRYTGGLPLPDFDDVAYWRKKFATLMAKREEVRAGRVKHHFTAAERTTLQLVERDREAGADTGAQVGQQLTGVKAWLGLEEKTQRTTTPTPPESRSTSVSAHSSSSLVAGAGTSSRGTEDDQSSSCSSTHTRKRKRPAADDNYGKPGPQQQLGKHPAKRRLAAQKQQTTPHVAKGLPAPASRRFAGQQKTTSPNPPSPGHASSTASDENSKSPSGLQKAPAMLPRYQASRSSRGNTAGKAHKAKTASGIVKGQQGQQKGMSQSAPRRGAGRGHNSQAQRSAAHTGLRRSARIAALAGHIKG